MSGSSPSNRRILLVWNDRKHLVAAPATRDDACRLIASEFKPTIYNTDRYLNELEVISQNTVFAVVWLGEAVVLGDSAFQGLKDGDEVFIEINGAHTSPLKIMPGSALAQASERVNTLTRRLMEDMSHIDVQEKE